MYLDGQHSCVKEDELEELRQVMKDLAMLRFRDLQRLEIVNNRVTLARWIASLGFPAPVKLGPNTVAWKAADVKEWLDGRAANSSQSEDGA